VRPAGGNPGRAEQGDQEDDLNGADVSMHGGDHYKLDVPIHWLKSSRPGGRGDLRNLL
jgi:hypothetical protein